MAGSNNFGAEGAKALAHTIRECQKLTRIAIGTKSVLASVETSDLGVEGAKALAPALETCSSLIELSIGSILAEGEITSRFELHRSRRGESIGGWHQTLRVAIGALFRSA